MKKENKEFNLSEKIKCHIIKTINNPNHIEPYIPTFNVKEFIRETIEDFLNVTLTIEDIEIRFKKRAGGNLIWLNQNVVD